MSATVDTNILVYATNEADPVHAQARALVDKLAAGPELVYLFWPVTIGYLRIVTHPGILPQPFSSADAENNINQLLDLPHVRARGEEEGFWDLYRATAGNHARGNDVPDVHLAALMRQYDVAVIYTRDRGFRRYEGIEAKDPFG